MSKTVDDRVVSLEFDNAQFEKSVNETLKMLENLKKSLNFDKSASNFSAISDASKKVDLSSVGESIDKLNDKFSTMRMVGLMALSNIVDGAMQMAKKIGSILMAPFNQIKTGGWARAMKIEDAKFMLEGLKVEWDKISKDINYGVSDTAYGLDEAAKAASQLVASGVKFGETYGETGNSPMAKALRGISGVAAMANSSYEEISSIFTTVAGQGKLMTMQMRQLESRGLNVAATMATEFNKVVKGESDASEGFQKAVKSLSKNMEVGEADIRDFVSKGKINFAIFSEAMDEAFGDHAKDANKTFNGALANIKAALSKIGAEFATPLIHDAIPVLNAIRLMVNAIKANMGGVFEIFARLTNIVGTSLTSKIEGITHKLEIFNKFALYNVNAALKILVAGLLRILNTVKKVYNEVFGGGGNESIEVKMTKFGQKLRHIAEVLYPTDEALNSFASALKVVFTIVKKVGDAIKFLITNVGGPLFNVFIKVISVVAAVIGKFVDLITVVVTVGKYFNNASEAVRQLQEKGFKIAGEKAEKFKNVLTKVRDILSKVGEAAKTALKYIAIGVAGIVVAPIYLLYQGFLKLTQLDWSKFVAAIKNAKALVVELFTKFKESEFVQNALEGIKTAIELVVGGVIYLGEKVGEFFNKLANGEVTLESIKSKLEELPNGFRKIGDKIANFFKGNKLFGAIGGGLAKIKDVIVDFARSIPGMLKELSPAKVMLITFSASMLLLSLKANTLMTALIKVTEWFKLTTLFRRKTSTLMKSVTEISNAILALAASIFILSKIPNLKETVTILGSLIGAMSLIGIVYGVLNKVLATNAKTGVTGSLFWQFSRDLTLMAIGVGLIAAALVKLNDLELEGSLKKIGVLTLALLAVAGIHALLTNPKWNLVGSNGLNVLLSMVGYAIALYAASKALKRLDEVDLSGLKGKWPEITAVLIGTALAAKAIAGIGIAVFAGAVSFFIAFKIVSKKMEELAKDTDESANETTTIVQHIKDSVAKTGQLIKDIIAGLFESFKTDPFGTIFGFLAKISPIALAIVGVVLAIKKISGAFVLVSTVGKHAKKAAKSFVLIMAAVAGMVLLATYIAKSIKENPGLMGYIVQICAIMAGLMVVVGVMASLAQGQYANPVFMKRVKQTFSSIAAVMLSLTAFMAVVGDLKESQFNRAYKALVTSISIIGVMNVIIGFLAIFAKGENKAGFGTFAGMTMLFAAMMGSLAMLMLVLKTDDDYKKLAAALVSVVAVIGMMSLLMYTVSKIHYNATWKTLLTMIGGLVVIGTAIALLAKQLPDQGYVGKVITISIAMVAVLTALSALALAINHFTKKSAFSLTKTNTAAIPQILKNLGVLVLAFVGIAKSISWLADMDIGKIATAAGVITLVVLALSSIALGLNKLSKNNGFNEVGAIIPLLATLTIMFVAIGAVLAAIVKISPDAISMLAVSQVITLCILELSIIAFGLSKLTKDMSVAIAALPTLLVLTIIFSVIGVVLAACTALGQSADRMLAVSQVIMLCILELSAISAGLGALTEAAGITVLSMGALPTLLVLTIIFGILGDTIAACTASGQSADRMLAVSQVIILCLLEFAAIAGLLGVVGVLDILAGKTAINMLYGLAEIFSVLGITLATIATLPLTDDSIKNKLDLIKGVLWSLIGMLAVLSLLSAGVNGMSIGVSSLGALITELSLLTNVLKALETVDTVSVSTGLNSVAEALQLLFTAAAAAALLIPGLATLGVTAVALGVACLAAGAGIKLFSDGIANLANTTPAQLNTLVRTVESFFKSVGNGVAIGLQTITQMVIDGLVALRIAAINIAQGFLPDLKNALLGNTAGLQQAAYLSGESVSYAWVEGFRVPVGWHSPPQIVIDFFKDTINAVANEGKPLTQAMSESGAKAAEAFKSEFASYDISSVTQAVGLNSVNGLTNGVAAGIPGLEAQVNTVLGIMNQLTLAEQGYKSTLTDFQYQLDTQVSMTENRIKTLQNYQKYSNTTDFAKYQKEIDELNGQLETQKAKAEEFGKTLPWVADGIEEVAEEVTGLGGAAGGAGSSMKDFQSSLQQTLESQMNIFQKFEQKAAMSKEELLGNMRSQIEGMANWAAQMQQLATLGIDKGLYQKLAEMGPQGAEYVGAFASMTAEELQEANTLWAQSLVLPGQAAAMIGGSYNKLGIAIPTSIAAGINAEKLQYLTAIDTLSTDGVKEFHDGDWRFGSPSRTAIEFGRNIALGMKEGIEQNQKSAIDAIDVMCQAMVMKAEKILNGETFAAFGVNIVNGITAGLNDEEANKKLNSSMASLSEKLQKTFTGPEEEGGNEIESPSKVFYRFGKYIDEGLANGIDAYSGKVLDSTEDLSNTALTAMRYTVANIASMINDEMEDPVITPILDLSNVQAGVRTLNNVLAGNKALMAGGVTEEMLQNGKSPIGGTTFIQNNYSPKALSRADIYRQTRNQFAQYKQQMG